MPPSRAEALLEAQKNVLEMIVRDQPLASVLEALCRSVEERAPAGTHAVILLADAEGRRLHTTSAPSLDPDYHRRLDGIRIDPNRGTCAAAAARREAVVTRSLAQDPGWRGIAAPALAAGLRAGWSMPILAADGTVLGTFGAYFAEEREPSAEERQLVEVLVRTAALAIERQRTDAEMEASARRHRFLSELGTATQQIADPMQIMQVSAHMLAEHLDVDRCAYAEVEDECVFVIGGEACRDAPSVIGRWPVAAFGQACVDSMLANQPFVVDDVDADPRIAPEDLKAYRATTIAAVICVPLHKEGRFTAAMAVHSRTPREWTADEIELVSIVVARCWEALERIRISRSLRESEERHRAIIEASPECIVLIACEGRILQINPAGLRMLQLEATRLPGSIDMQEFVAPPDRERFRAFHKRVCNGERGSLEYDLIGHQGRRRRVITTAVPLALPGGGHAHLGMTRDITIRVATERALAESRSRLDFAVRLSGVGFFYCDLPFDELNWDEHVRDHFFVGADEHVTFGLFLQRIHEEDRERTARAIEASIRDRVPFDAVYRTVEPGTGTVKWIRALGGTAYDEAGKPIRFDGVTVDVTEPHNDRERLEELNARLREQDRRKDEFLATLAHELRNPLAPIRTGVAILRSGASGEHAGRVHDMMERQLGHLVRMVDDLLDISRVTLGKVSLHCSRVDFHDIVHAAVESARPAIEAARHELSLRLAPTPLPLYGDSTRLAQVVANLLNNAARYTPAGGHIELVAEACDGWLQLTVSDSGQGIPPHMLERVFELFTQVQPSTGATHGGLGLGLTLVRRLVEMHGGHVEAASEGTGRGSTFTVQLPLLSDASQEPGPRVSGTKPAAETPLRVLVVDDNVDAADALAMLLSLRGHEPGIANTGEEALSKADELQPDVAFVDIGLPGIDGYEVARRLRAWEGGRRGQLLLAALTGWGAEEHRQTARAAGFDLHLVKPVDLAHLDQVLSRAAGAEA